MERKILVFDNTMESIFLLLNMIESPEKFVMEEVEELYLFRVSSGYPESVAERCKMLDMFNRIIDCVKSQYDIPFEIKILMNHPEVIRHVNKQIRPGVPLYEQIIYLLTPLLHHNDDVYFGSLENPDFPVIQSMRAIVGIRHVWINFPFTDLLADLKYFMKKQFEGEDWNDIQPILRQPVPKDIVLQEL